MGKVGIIEVLKSLPSPRNYQDSNSLYSHMPNLSFIKGTKILLLIYKIKIHWKHWWVSVAFCISVLYQVTYSKHYYCDQVGDRSFFDGHCYYQPLSLQPKTWGSQIQHSLPAPLPFPGPEWAFSCSRLNTVTPQPMVLEQITASLGLLPQGKHSSASPDQLARIMWGSIMWTLQMFLKNS